MMLRYISLTVLMLVLLQGCTSTNSRKDADLEQASQLYSDLGLAYLQQGEVERAQAKLEKAIELNDSNAAAHHYIAEAYKRLGDAEFAEKHYKVAMRLSPSDAMLLNNYGTFLCGQSRFDDAESFFVKAAQVHRYRTPELAYENVALCALRSARPEKAMEYFRKALAIKPYMPKSLFQSAQLSYNTGENLKARAFLQRLHDGGGQSEQSLNLAIQVERALGDEKAVKRLQLALEALLTKKTESEAGTEEQ